MNPCAMCGVDLEGNDGHGHGAREIAAHVDGIPMPRVAIPGRTWPPEGACVDAISDGLTPDELARALDGQVTKLVFFVKAKMSPTRRRDVIEQAFRDAVAWLEVGHDFDVQLVRT